MIDHIGKTLFLSLLGWNGLKSRQLHASETTTMGRRQRMHGGSWNLHPTPHLFTGIHPRLPTHLFRHPKYTVYLSSFILFFFLIVKYL